MPIRAPTERSAIAFAVALLLFGLPSRYAAADESSSSIFQFGGYGTLGVVHSSESNADFATSALKPNGAGYTRAWSASVDSLVAAQVTANFTPQLSAMVQVVSEQNYDNTYWPHVEWANLKYALTSDFSVRVGRIVLPSFLLSDARKVGYSNPTVRPPIEVYALFPITNSDGVDASYRVHTGTIVQTFVATYGSSRPTIPTLGSAEGRRDWLVADTIEYEDATFHIAYQQSHVTIDYLGTLFDTFRQFGPQGNALADKYDQEDRLFTFLAFGGIYNPGRWFAGAEWGTVDFHSVLGKRTAWYASGGYRVGRFTPYLSYARARGNNFSDPGLTVASLPPSLQLPASELNAALNTLLNAKPVQNTITAGVRWDFRENVDFKLQLNRTRLGTGSAGDFVNVQPGFRTGGNINLIAATVDWVF